jgi:hypothetical protein
MALAQATAITAPIAFTLSTLIKNQGTDQIPVSPTWSLSQSGFVKEANGPSSTDAQAAGRSKATGQPLTIIHMCF